MGDGRMDDRWRKYDRGVRVRELQRAEMAFFDTDGFFWDKREQGGTARRPSASILSLSPFYPFLNDFFRPLDLDFVAVGVCDVFSLALNWFEEKSAVFFGGFLEIIHPKNIFYKKI